MKATRAKLRFGFGSWRKGTPMSPRSASPSQLSAAISSNLDEVVFKRAAGPNAALQKLLGELGADLPLMSSPQGPASASSPSSSSHSPSASSLSPASSPSSSNPGAPLSSSRSPSSSRQDLPGSAGGEGSGKMGPVSLYLRLVYTAFQMSLNQICWRLGIEGEGDDEAEGPESKGGETKGAGEGPKQAPPLLTARPMAASGGGTGKMDVSAFSVEKVRELLQDLRTTLEHQHHAESKILFRSLEERGIGTAHFELLHSALLADLSALLLRADDAYSWRALKQRLRNISHQIDVVRSSASASSASMAPSASASSLHPSSSAASLLAPAGSFSLSPSILSSSSSILSSSSSSNFIPSLDASSSPSTASLSQQKAIGETRQARSQQLSGEAEERLLYFQSEIALYHYHMFQLKRQYKTLYQIRVELQQLFRAFAKSLRENLVEQEAELQTAVSSAYSTAEEAELLRKVLAISSSQQITRFIPWVVRHLPTSEEQSYLLRLMDSILPFRFYDICLGIHKSLPAERRGKWEECLNIKLPRLDFLPLSKPVFILSMLSITASAIRSGIETCVSLLQLSSIPLQELLYALNCLRLLPIFLFQLDICLFPEVELVITALDNHQTDAPKQPQKQHQSSQHLLFQQQQQQQPPIPILVRTCSSALLHPNPPALSLPTLQPQVGSFSPLVAFRTMHQRIILLTKEAFSHALSVQQSSVFVPAAIRANEDLCVLFDAYLQLLEGQLLPFCRSHLPDPQQGLIVRSCLGLPPGQYHDHLLPWVLQSVALAQQQEFILCLAASFPASQFKLYAARLTATPSDHFGRLREFVDGLLPKRPRTSRTSSTKKKHKRPSRQQ
ncbi:MAG: hypothetical protein Q8P67_17635 [archaeon]|nr:hypothetical protein [archaeon]